MLYLLRLSILLLVTVPVSFGLRDRVVSHNERVLLDATQGKTENRTSLERTMARWKAEGKRERR